MNPADRRLRVCLLTHLFPTANDPSRGSFVLDYADQIAEAGCQVDLCVSRNRFTLPLSMPFNFARYLLANRPDIVHAHLGVPGGVVASAFKTRAPVVVTVYRGEVMNKFTRKMLPWVVDRADLTICVSDAIRAEVVAACGRDSQKIVTLRSAVDVEAYRPVESSVWRNRYSIPRESILVTSLALFQPRKRIDLLIKAAARLVRKHDVFVLIAGKGGCQSELAKLVADLGLGDRVIMVGEVSGDSKVRLLSESDIFVFPSESEGFSFAVLEAMACQNAMILSDIQPHREAVVDGVSGIIVQHDEDAIACQLEALILDSDKRCQLAANARATVESRFGSSVWAADLLDRYRGLLAKRC